MVRHQRSFPRASRITAGKSKIGEAIEKASGMYSARCRKKLVLWARKISGANPARLNNANSSTHIRGLRYHLRAGSMLFAYFFSRTANFDQMLQDGIIAVPLDKIRATHKSPVFGCATEVMPQVEVFELNGLVERSRGQEAVMAHPVHHSLPGEDLFVGGLNDGLGFLVNPFDQWWRVTLHTNVLHVCLRPNRIRTGLGYLGKEKIGESFGRIVGNATSV